jgi:hypothetical protein
VFPSLQVTFLTLLVKRLDNSLVLNARLPGYVNLTTSPFLATFQVWLPPTLLVGHCGRASEKGDCAALAEVCC